MRWSWGLAFAGFVIGYFVWLVLLAVVTGPVAL